jgi:hypothetical protein
LVWNFGTLAFVESEFDFSQGTGGKAKGRETASRPSMGWFNNRLE